MLRTLTRASSARRLIVSFASVDDEGSASGIRNTQGTESKDVARREK